MKVIKTALSKLVLLALITGGMLSCTKDKEKIDKADEIVGVWTLQNTEIVYDVPEGDDVVIRRDFAEDENPSEVEFLANGQLKIREWKKNEEEYQLLSGTYEVENSKIKVTIGAFDNKWVDFSLNGRNLYIQATERIEVEELGLETDVTLKASLTR